VPADVHTPELARVPHETLNLETCFLITRDGLDVSLIDEELDSVQAKIVETDSEELNQNRRTDSLITESGITNDELSNVRKSVFPVDDRMEEPNHC
jgi:hypothetical protein